MCYIKLSKWDKGVEACSEVRQMWLKKSMFSCKETYQKRQKRSRKIKNDQRDLYIHEKNLSETTLFSRAYLQLRCSRFAMCCRKNKMLQRFAMCCSKSKHVVDSATVHEPYVADSAADIAIAQPSLCSVHLRVFAPLCVSVSKYSWHMRTRNSFAHTLEIVSYLHIHICIHTHTPIHVQKHLQSSVCLCIEVFARKQRTARCNKLLEKKSVRARESARVHARERERDPETHDPEPPCDR